MLSGMLAHTARRPRLVLSAAIAVVVGIVWLGRTASAGLGRDLAHGFVILGALAAALSSLMAISRRRQAAFVVDPRTPAFRTPVHEAQVYLAVAMMLFAANGSLDRIPGTGSGERPPFSDLVSRLMTAPLVVLYGMVVLLSIAYVISVWRGPGVRLGPDGVVDKGPFGSLVVPWAALTPGYPQPVPAAAGYLVLSYARPELVRRRGLVLFRRLVQSGNVDASFLSYAIRYYADHPHHRPTIGTHAGYEDLRQAFQSDLTLTLPASPRLTPLNPPR